VAFVWNRFYRRELLHCKPTGPIPLTAMDFTASSGFARIIGSNSALSLGYDIKILLDNVDKAMIAAAELTKKQNANELMRLGSTIRHFACGQAVC